MIGLLYSLARCMPTFFELIGCFIGALDNFCQSRIQINVSFANGSINFPPVLQGLGNMPGITLFGMIQIGNGSSHLQHFMIGSS